MALKFYKFFDKYWFYLALVLKTLLLAALVYADKKSGFGFFTGFTKNFADYDEQLGTIDNLVKHGTLGQFMSGKVEPYAGRTPGFIFPYFIFRLFANSLVAGHLQVICQIILNIIAARCFYNLVLKYTYRKSLSIVAFFIVFIANYLSWIDFELSSESYANSAFVIAMFLLDKHFTTISYKKLFVAGMLFGWCFFLRGFTIAYGLVIFLGFFLLCLSKKVVWNTFVKSVFVLFTPFIIIVSVWTTRNYIQFNKIIPLQNVYIPGQNFKGELSPGDPSKYSVVKVRKLLCAWGGDCLWTYPGTDMDWMLDRYHNSRFPFRDGIFCDGFSKDSLYRLKQLISISFSDTLTWIEQQDVESNIVSTSENYLNTFKKSHPFTFALSPVLRLQHFFNKNVVADWPVLKGYFIYYYKLIPLITYYLVVLGALIGLTFLVIKKQINLLVGIFAGQVIILLSQFAFLIELVHYRYFSTAYLACLFIVLFAAGKWYNNKHDGANLTPGNF